MHESYPVILERAIISRGVLMNETQDQLVGFAWSENEVAKMLSLGTPEAVGLVRATPVSFVSDLPTEDCQRAGRAGRHWFVSRADEEIHLAFGAIRS